MSNVQISHDAFARQSLERRLVDTTETCTSCGQKRRKGPKLFEYGTAPDDSLRGRVNWHKGLFCSKSCHDDYHA